jgi:hypothetical protein
MLHAPKQAVQITKSGLSIIKGVFARGLRGPKRVSYLPRCIGTYDARANHPHSRHHVMLIPDRWAHRDTPHSRASSAL